MPEIEVRIVDYEQLNNPALLRALETIHPDTISLGSDSCFRQLPAVDTLVRLLDGLRPYRRKFVVPMLFESHFDAVCATIDAVVDQVDVVGVNDYGVLRYLSERHRDKVSRVTLGSGVSYSYEECPWHEHIVRDECETVKRALLRSNVDNSWMYDVMGTFPFALEIEVPALPGMTASAAELRRKGMAVAVLADGVPVSCARACHTARYLGLAVDNCGCACLKKAVLRATHRWDFFQGDIKEIRPVVREQMPSLTVWGNMIYVPNPNPDPITAMQRGDSVVFDYRFYESPAHLENAVTGVRQALKRKGTA